MERDSSHEYRYQPGYVGCRKPAGSKPANLPNHVDRVSALALLASQRFGPLQINVRSEFNKPGHPEIYTVSNIQKDGKPIGSGDAGEQTVPCVGSTHAAQLLRSVQRETVDRQVFAPERHLEPFPQGFGLLQESDRSRRIAQARGQRGGMAFRRIDIALDLAQCDRAFRHAAILVEDRVV